MTAYDVSRRNAELAIRIALGSQPWSVVRLMVWRSVRLVGCGIGLGLFAAVVLMRITERLVYGVRATEPASLLIPVLILLAIGAAAAYWPARKVSSIDPVVVLREQ